MSIKSSQLIILFSSTISLVITAYWNLQLLVAKCQSPPIIVSLSIYLSIFTRLLIQNWPFYHYIIILFLFLLIFLALKSTLFEINTDTPGFFWLVLPWYIFHHLLLFFLITTIILFIYFFNFSALYLFFYLINLMPFIAIPHFTVSPSSYFNSHVS